jgi:hypothetical protein
MNHEEETMTTMDPAAAMAHVRADLITAITADRAQAAARRRIVRRGLLAVAVVFAGATTAVAATTGLFAPAPRDVQRSFEQLSTPGHQIDASKAVAIGVIDDHAAYAAPTADGGFCLYFGSNLRSGPTGGSCLPHAVEAGAVAFSLSLGTDGGFVFGRAGNAQARSIAISFPHGGGTLTATVGEERFFLAPLTPRALRSLTVEIQPGPKDPPTKDGGPLQVFQTDRIAAVTAVVRDASGATIARGRAAELSAPGGADATTTTGTTP